MKSIFLIVVASACLNFLTGCQSEEDQVYHTQQRQQDRLMKQMQKQQEAAKKLSGQSDDQ
ncbi:MAG TPA: hypothetical protein VHG71_03635 [Verrucomicrobiae bacterium]|nr:hypothetical protein [Verrucomicrobiae bacterium]